MPRQFLEILFDRAIQPDDLEVISPASPTQPGRVRLKLAHLGPCNPAAPSSIPLVSVSGAKIGFVAIAELIEPPFTGCYWLEPITELDQEGYPGPRVATEG